MDKPGWWWVTHTCNKTEEFVSRVRPRALLARETCQQVCLACPSASAVLADGKAKWIPRP